MPPDAPPMPPLELPMPRLAAPLSAPLRPLAGILLAAALLSGCGSGEMAFAPACPQLSLLAEGADLTRFRGPGRDVTDRVLEARITGVDAACRSGRGGDVAAVLTVRAELSRGLAAQGRQVQVPYFVAVMNGDAIVDRQGFVLDGTFPANVDTIAVAGRELELRFPGTAAQGAANYRIIVSLQLTEEELAHTRRTALR
jgi:hypothetical protein